MPYNNSRFCHINLDLRQTSIWLNVISSPFKTDIHRMGHSNEPGQQINTQIKKLSETQKRGNSVLGLAKLYSPFIQY